MSRRLSVLLLGVLLAGACSFGGSDDGPKKADYTPIPDAELYASIAALPGVEKVDVAYNGTWPESKYGGEITIASGVDAQQVLDQAYAVLRQGRFDVGISVFGLQDNTSIKFDGLDGRSGIPSELTQRYGPQPGDGTPPVD
ncbi:MAG: hypothetical protein ABWX74_07850 [Aeromicrobium sp.]